MEKFENIEEAPTIKEITQMNREVEAAERDKETFSVGIAEELLRRAEPMHRKADENRTLFTDTEKDSIDELSVHVQELRAYLGMDTEESMDEGVDDVDRLLTADLEEN